MSVYDNEQNAGLSRLIGSDVNIFLSNGTRLEGIIRAVSLIEVPFPRVMIERNKKLTIVFMKYVASIAEG